MTAEDLISLVNEITRQKCEKQHIEIKEAFEGAPKRLYGTLSSFSNQTGGGIIIFGISEKEGFGIVGVYDAQDLQVKVVEQCNQMSPPIRPLFTVAEIDGKIVVSAEIMQTDIYDRPCFYMGAGRLKGSYIRCGDADIPMTEYEVYSYEAFKRKTNDELRIVERADMSAFDEVEAAQYLNQLKKEKPNLSSMSNGQLMQFQGLIEKSVPTIAGIMLLGVYPQGFFPQLSITAMLVAGEEITSLGNEERFIDNKRIEGTIPQMLEGALNFIRRNMKTKTVIDENTASRRDVTEYPLKAIREIILNCLIHRDYSVHTESSPIRIVMYKNRIEVENPGGLYGRLTIDKLGEAAADTRNPFIAGALEVMLKTENRFSGVPTIIHAMKEAGLPPPVFESSRGVFKVTLYNSEIKADNNFALSSKKTIAEKILSFCLEPRSREEIAKEFGFESPYYLMSKYVYPLVQDGKLALTLPTVPKSKRQRFIKV